MGIEPRHRLKREIAFDEAEEAASSKRLVQSQNRIEEYSRQMEEVFHSEPQWVEDEFLESPVQDRSLSNMSCSYEGAAFVVLTLSGQTDWFDVHSQCGRECFAPAFLWRSYLRQCP